MASASIDMSGLEDLLSSLTRLRTGAEDLKDKAIKEASDNLKREMESIVALSGVNHQHIKNDIKIQQEQGHSFIGVGKDTGFRAHFLEFGTSKMPAKPFMQKALENSRRENINIMMRVLREGLGL